MGLRPTRGDEGHCHPERSEGSAVPALAPLGERVASVASRVRGSVTFSSSFTLEMRAFFASLNMTVGLDFTPSC